MKEETIEDIYVVGYTTISNDGRDTKRTHILMQSNNLELCNKKLDYWGDKLTKTALLAKEESRYDYKSRFNIIDKVFLRNKTTKKNITVYNIQKLIKWVKE